MIKLYGTPPTRVIRPLWLLNELGLEYELIPVDLMGGEHLKPEFRALNPAGKVPVLVDGDFVLTESAAIQLYLAEKVPEAGLIPDDAKARARMHSWMYFLVTEIEQPLWRIARHTFIYPEEKRLLRDCDLAREECLDMIAVLERHMQGREYLVGERPTVADFNAAYTLDWAFEVGMLEKAPRLVEFLESMYARPAAPMRIGESKN